MIRKNVMSALLAAVATAVVLVAYNAFWQSSSNSQSATNRISSYLKLDTAAQESTGADTNVVGTDNAQAQVQTQPSQTSTEAGTSQSQDQSSTQPQSANTSEPTTVSTAGSDKPETTYDVKEGDTYGCIAEKYYGSFEHYVDIMRVNPTSQRGFSERHLYVDAVLVLPAIAQANLKPASHLCQ